MALNSRQKRTRKRKLALALLATSRNPPMVASKGSVRSVWSKTMPPRAVIREQAWEGSGKVGKSVKGRFVPKPKPVFTADGSPVKSLEKSEMLTAATKQHGQLNREAQVASRTAQELVMRKREKKWGVKLT